MPLRDFVDEYPALIKRLLQARKGGRVSHAYLFTGDQLESLMDLVMGWAQACACPTPTPEGDACGACTVCRQLTNETYPYLLQLRPQSKSRMILVDDIRDLEHRLYLKTEGQVKVGLIIEADRMKEEAQNAFLKTLEEPAGNTLLILVSINPAALLNTIRSRCQTISLLENRMTYELPGQAELVALLARLRRGTGAQQAIEATEYLVKELKSLKKQADKRTKTQVSQLKAQYSELEPAQRKRVDAQIDAVVAAEYLNLREMFLSALHTWFAQEYLRAAGADHEVLPNPELLDLLPEEARPEPPPEMEARQSLKLTEELLRSLHYNVDEVLAIQDYCQRVCAK